MRPPARFDLLFNAVLIAEGERFTDTSTELTPIAIANLAANYADVSTSIIIGFPV
jgi:hypothetical protein